MLYNGGPAFPVSHYVNDYGETLESQPTGMTLRDFFVAHSKIPWDASRTMAQWAILRGEEADALLEERNKNAS